MPYFVFSAFVFLISFIALIAHIHVKPFKAPLDNLLQGNALIAIVITVVFALYKMSATTIASSADTDTVSSSEMIVLVMNVAVVGTTLLTVVMLTKKIR